MTADVHQEAELRHRVIDYLVTNIGCAPQEIDLDLSLNDLGVGCPDAAVLSGELSGLLGRQPHLTRAFSADATKRAARAFLINQRGRCDLGFGDQDCGTSPVLRHNWVGVLARGTRYDRVHSIR